VQARCEQLGAGDDAVLPAGELVRAGYWSHSDH
jgi:hypothetical protein